MPPRTAPAQPVLEINQRPIHDLRHLIELIGQRRVERELNVHRTTIARWLDGTVRMPGAQWLGVRSLLGHLPGTAGRWDGWRFHDGRLLSPAGEAFTAGDVISLILLRQQLAAQRQQLAAQRQELEALRVRLAIAEQAVETLAPSANDARLYG